MEEWLFNYYCSSHSVTRLLVHVFNLGHLQQWNFAQYHTLFCQSRFKMLPKLNKPSKYCQSLLKFAKVAKFRQIWSHCSSLIRKQRQEEEDIRRRMRQSRRQQTPEGYLHQKHSSYYENSPREEMMMGYWTIDALMKNSEPILKWSIPGLFLYFCLFNTVDSRRVI